MDVIRWGRLSGKQQWDILVALRGPDCGNSEIIKWFTTGVIRGEMSPVMRVGGTVNTDLKCVVLPEKFQSSYLSPGSGMPWNSGHFFQHVAEAATILGLPLVVVKQEQWDKAMSMGVGNAVGVLVEGVDQEDKSSGVIELIRYSEYLGFRKKGLKKSLLGLSPGSNDINNPITAGWEGG